jgi:hypothetical protein
MGRPAITGFIVRKEHSVLKFGMGIVSNNNNNNNNNIYLLQLGCHPVAVVI